MYKLPMAQMCAAEKQIRNGGISAAFERQAVHDLQAKSRICAWL